MPGCGVQPCATPVAAACGYRGERRLRSLFPTFFSQSAAAVEHDDREDGDGLCAERVGVCVDAEPVELEERHRSCAKDPGFLQGFDAMAGEDDGQGAQQRGVDAEEYAQWQFG